jgi:hypothetical protein
MNFQSCTLNGVALFIQHLSSCISRPSYGPPVLEVVASSSQAWIQAGVSQGNQPTRGRLNIRLFLVQHNLTLICTGVWTYIQLYRSAPWYNVSRHCDSSHLTSLLIKFLMPLLPSAAIGTLNARYIMTSAFELALTPSRLAKYQ